MEEKTNPIFAKIGEKEITRAIVDSFTKQFSEYVESDVIIVGAGPSGLYAGKFIAKEGYKVLIVERNNYLGGGFWSGGYLMNKVTMRSPSEKELDEIGAPYEKIKEGLYVTDAAHACSKLIASACDAGVRIANMSMFVDVVLREENRVGGVVINWSPIKSLPREIACLDPIALESKIVIDSTGHDACVVKSLEARGILKTKGEGGMWVEMSEDLVVKHTGEVHPGLFITGMSVSATYGLPRMGPTFGGMFLSGKKAAEMILNLLKS